MLRDPASEKEYESVPELEPETGKVKVENTKETVAEESVNTADETAEKSAEAVSEENTEGLENADRSESAEEKKTFSTETETPVGERMKMPTLNIPDSMKNMVLRKRLRFPRHLYRITFSVMRLMLRKK